MDYKLPGKTVVVIGDNKVEITENASQVLLQLPDGMILSIQPISEDEIGFFVSKRNEHAEPGQLKYGMSECVYSLVADYVDA